MPSSKNIAGAEHGKGVWDLVIEGPAENREEVLKHTSPQRAG